VAAIVTRESTRPAPEPVAAPATEPGLMTAPAPEPIAQHERCIKQPAAVDSVS